MSLLFIPHSFGGLSLEDVFDDMLSWGDFAHHHPAMWRGVPSCGRAAAFGPAHCRAAAARACRRPAPAESPSQPELHLTRTSDGVLAECALGREFTEADISLKLDGRELQLTAFQPGTALSIQRPVVFRRTLELAPHIDAQRINATLEGGVLTLVFPYLAHGNAAAAQPGGQACGGPCSGAAACGGDGEQLARRCRRGPPGRMHWERRASRSPRRFAVRWDDDAGACGAACRRAHHAQRSPPRRHANDDEAGPSQPPTAAPPARTPAPAAAADPAGKGKAPASEEQAAELERRAAAQRIATGSASDEDWEAADGAVEDCPLEEEAEPEGAAEAGKADRSSE